MRGTRWAMGAALCLALSGAGWGRPGVLVGIQNRDNQRLRTVWLTEGAPVVEVTPLVVPRGTGFWRLGLLNGCIRERGSFEENGWEEFESQHLWAAPLG